MKSSALKKSAVVERTPAPKRTALDFSWLDQSRAIFLIVAATLIVYANSLGGAFVFDDTKQIVGNPQLHSWGNIIRAFANDVWSFQRGTLTADLPPPYYRPLFTAYLTVNYQLFGLWESGWHVMNLLVHVSATLLVYFLIKRLSGNQVIATFAGLLFSLHPAHVESVSWISGIPDPLSALFYIPSFIWYLRYREEGSKKWLGLSLTFYGLSALCKETPLALPMVFIVWELVQLRGTKALSSRLSGVMRLMIPYGIVAVGYLILRFSILGRISWKHPYMARVPGSSIWMTVPYVLSKYIQHLIAPFHLSLIYGTSFLSTPSDPRLLVSVLLLLAIAIALCAFRKKVNSQVWVALALLLAPLLPVLNLSVFHYEYIIQDRYLYLPSIGFCYLVSMSLVWLSRKRAALALALSALLLVSYGISTYLQNGVWHSSVALWERAIDFAPGSWSTHYNLALAYLDMKNAEKAASELLEAKRLNPDKAVIYNNLALAQASLGDKESAVGNLKTALTLEPELLEAHNNLGALLYDKGDYTSAKREFLIVLQRDPTSVSARFNLARTLAASDEHQMAIKEFETVIARQPDDSEAHYQLGLSYEATGRTTDAIRQIQLALNCHPDGGSARKMEQKLREIQR